MMDIKIEETRLKEAALKGMDAFIGVVRDAILEAIGGELNAETMPLLNAEQITLLAYGILREEVLDGGFVQLLHNGYGPFFFRNPFVKAIRQWGVSELPAVIRKASSLFKANEKELTRDCSDEEFMALFEKYPQFDELDDRFLMMEEKATAIVARHVDEHIGNFVTVLK
ncbi:MAG: DMP19 family protein [Prevotellaceae bacterium]|nr:DMP19 family protein [Prevotellaceae bacterium]